MFSIENKQKRTPHIYFKISIVSSTPLNHFSFSNRILEKNNSLTFFSLISCLTGKDFSIYGLSEEKLCLQVLISRIVRMGKIYGNQICHPVVLGSCSAFWDHELFQCKVKCTGTIPSVVTVIFSYFRSWFPKYRS